MQCYLVAKDRNEHGCYAIKTTLGEHLVTLKRELNNVVAHKGIEIITLSRPIAFGEYAPYHFIHDENEFIAKVKEMVSK